MRLKSSIVARSFAAFLFILVVLCTVVPYNIAFFVALATAFGACVSAAVKYGHDAFLSFRDGREGADFLIVAVFAIITAMLSVILYWFVLRIAPESMKWLSRSAVSIAVPLFIAWAVFLSLVAPDLVLKPDEARAGIWKSVAIFVGGALAGFVLAASSGLNNSEESSAPIVFPHLANRSTCPISSVWGSSRRIYHTMTSPYRQTLMPSHCFKTVKEAEEAGFRPPASR